MNRKQFRLYLFLTIGIIILVITYKMIEWVSTFSLLTWFMVGLILISAFLVNRHIKEQDQKIKNEAQKRALARLSNLKDLKNLHYFQFEEVVCDLFIQLGYDAHVTKASGDRGKIL